MNKYGSKGDARDGFVVPKKPPVVGMFISFFIECGASIPVSDSERSLGGISYNSTVCFDHHVDISTIPGHSAHYSMA